MEDILFNKDNFLIVGAGGLGRELESWVSESVNFNEKFCLKGFIDDNTEALSGFQNHNRVLGPVSKTLIERYKYFLLGVADPLVKENLHIKINDFNGTVISFLHNFSVIGKHTKIGEGLVMCPFSVISCNVNIGCCVFLNLGSHIGHDSKIGSYSSIMANVDIGGGVQLGKRTFVGSNAVILPGVKIVDNVKIGAGSVVFRNIKEPGTYFGNPAKRIV